MSVRSVVGQLIRKLSPRVIENQNVNMVGALKEKSTSVQANKKCSYLYKTCFYPLTPFPLCLLSGPTLRTRPWIKTAQQYNAIIGFCVQFLFNQ